jgi:hypothetical protein
LAKCQRFLEAYCRENDVVLALEEPNRVAAIIIELSQHCVRDEKQLRALVAAARGLIQKPGTKAAA